MATTRKLTVQEDDKGVFVKFRVFEKHWLIIRPGVIDCFGGNGFKFEKGNKVHVSYWNQNMGFFMVKMACSTGSRCIWQGPHWVRDSYRGEWVGEQIKAS